MPDEVPIHKVIHLFHKVRRNFRHLKPHKATLFRDRKLLLILVGKLGLFLQLTETGGLGLGFVQLRFERLETGLALGENLLLLLGGGLVFVPGAAERVPVVLVFGLVRDDLLRGRGVVIRFLALRRIRGVAGREFVGEVHQEVARWRLRGGFLRVESAHRGFDRVERIGRGCGGCP